MDDNTLKRMKGIIMEEMLRDDPELLDKLMGFVSEVISSAEFKPLMTTERKLAVLNAMDIKVLEYTNTRVVVKIMVMTLIFEKSDNNNFNMSINLDMNALGALV